MILKKMSQAVIWFLVMSIFCIVISSCTSKLTKGKKGVAVEEETEVVSISYPAFNADTALKYVFEQTAFGPRIPNSKAQRQCAEYFKDFFSKYAHNVEIQEFEVKRWDGENLKGYNIIASFNKEKPFKILLGAHWDSRPYADHDKDETKHKTPIDGANDGASGAAVLMEIARVLYEKNPNIGVDIVLFDLEDSGRPDWAYKPNSEETWCLGSQYWSNNSIEKGYKANYGILLDMVGTPNPLFTREATSVYYASDILDKVWDLAAEKGYYKHFVNTQTGGIIDDHLFVNRITGIPMINIIHYDINTANGFFPHWHTMDDKAENISASSLKMVGDVVLETIYSE